MFHGRDGGPSGPRYEARVGYVAGSHADQVPFNVRGRDYAGSRHVDVVKLSTRARIPSHGHQDLVFLLRLSAVILKMGWVADTEACDVLPGNGWSCRAFKYAVYST